MQKYYKRNCASSVYSPGMADPETSWRERKKQKTRRALADAASRLFAKRGYEETTIADLATAAEIAPRTFFSYFPAKEDVLFADVDDRIARLSRLELRRGSESLRDGLRRVAREVVDSVMADVGGDEAKIRIGIIDSQPSLQAAALLRQRAAERMLAGRLHAAYPHELDKVVAAAVVGAFTSAIRAAAEEPGSRRSSRAAEQVVDRVRRLLEHGLEA
jgi:AcrR family transcriptional regulator